MSLQPQRKQRSFIKVLFKELSYMHPQKGAGERQERQQKTYFVWQEQIHSSFSHPEEWSYPLQLLLNAVNITGAHPVTSPPKSNNSVTELPQSLPVICHASHRHTWRSSQVCTCKIRSYLWLGGKMYDNLAWISWHNMSWTCMSALSNTIAWNTCTCPIHQWNEIQATLYRHHRVLYKCVVCPNCWFTFLDLACLCLCFHCFCQDTILQ